MGTRRVLDVAGGLELALDGGVRLGVAAGGPGLLALVVDLAGEGEELEPLRAPAVGREGDVEDVARLPHGAHRAGHDPEGHHVAAHGQLDGDAGRGAAVDVAGDHRLVGLADLGEDAAREVGLLAGGDGAGHVGAREGRGRPVRLQPEHAGHGAVEVVPHHELAERVEPLVGALHGDEALAELEQGVQVPGRQARGLEVDEEAEGGGLVVLVGDGVPAGAGGVRGLDREGDAVVADGDAVAGLEDPLDHRLAVDQGPVGAAQIADPPAAEGVAEHLGVAARDRVVVEHELDAGDAPDDQVRLGEDAPRGGAPVEADVEADAPQERARHAGDDVGTSSPGGWGRPIETGDGGGPGVIMSSWCPPPSPSWGALRRLDRCACSTSEGPRAYTARGRRPRPARQGFPGAPGHALTTLGRGARYTPRVSTTSGACRATSS